MAKGPIPKSPFQIFGLPSEYPVNRELIEARYRRLSMMVHPDFADKNLDRETVLKISSEVNSAYRLLRSPIQTLLFLASEVFGPQFNPAATKPKPEFLMQMMEKMEEIEEMDPTTEAYLNFKKQIQEEQNSLLDKIQAGLHLVDAESVSNLVAEFNYFERLRLNLEGRFA